MPQDNILEPQPQWKLMIPRAIVEDAADVLCRILIDSLQSPDRYKNIAKLTELERVGLSILGTLANTYAIFPKNMDDRLENVIKLILEEEQRARSNTFSAFLTRCPYCGKEGSIMVTEVTIAHTGEVLSLNVPLQSDGFDLDYQDDLDEKDLSTENERVRCNDCEMRFSLSNLMF